MKKENHETVLEGFNEVSELYDSRAGVYDGLMKKAGYDSLLDFGISCFSDYASSDSRILDIGCGTGNSTYFIKEYFRNPQIVGIDGSNEMLKIYHERNPEVPLFTGDFNFPEGFENFGSCLNQSLEDYAPFSGVVSSASVSEYGNLDKVIPFIYDILDDKGFLGMIGVRNNLLGKISGFFWKYSPAGEKRVEDCCYSSGFKDIHKIKIPSEIGFFPSHHKFVLVAEK